MPSNWDLNRTPATFDHVVIDVGGPVVRNITYSQGTTSIISLDSQEHVALSGGSLAAGQVQISNGLTISEGAALVAANVSGSPVTIGAGGARLVGVTLNEGMLLAGQTVTVQSGITLKETAALQAGNSMRFQGSQVLGGSGSISFDGGGAVTIDGGSTLTIAPPMSLRGAGGSVGDRTPGTIGVTRLVNDGRISAATGAGAALAVVPDVLTNTGTLEARDGKTLFINSSTLSNSGQIIARAGSAVDINSLVDAQSGSIGGAGAVRASRGMNINGIIIKPGGGALRVNGALLIPEGRTIDLMGGGIINDYSGSSSFTAIRERIISGYNAGEWDGSGITSTTANEHPEHDLSVGYAEAGALFTTFPALFLDESIDDTTVLARLVRYGDANLDGSVNLADFNRLANGFGQSGFWTEGDFNYDGVVNLADFNLLADNFGQSAAPGGPTSQDWAALAAAVPEPSTLGPVGVMVSAAMRRRRALSPESGRNLN